MSLECPECTYETDSGTLFIEHLASCHPDKANEIFLKFLKEGKIKITVT